MAAQWQDIQKPTYMFFVKQIPAENFYVNSIVKTGVFLYNWSVAGAGYIVSCVTDFRNRSVKVQDDIKQIEEVMAKRTAKNSVFLDLFQNKSYLLKLYKTLHPEDTTATEDSLTDVTITNVLTDNLYNDYSDFLFIPIVT